MRPQASYRFNPWPITATILALLALVAAACARRVEPRQPHNQAPAITLWYGAKQSAGAIGNPQRWFNILGNVSDTPEVAALTYSLNGDPARALSIGPFSVPTGSPACPESGARAWHSKIALLWNACRAEPASWECLGRHAWSRARNALPFQKNIVYPRRLYGVGDFNVEIDRDILHRGANRLELVASGRNNMRLASASVIINYTGARVWPLPFVVDWSSVSRISDAAQIVDGEWSKTPAGLRTASMGYDRVFAIGDVKWTDYEVTVPITIHAIDSAAYNSVSTAPGIGMVLHWRGHSYSPVPQCACSRPRCGWLPWGAYGLYDFGKSRFEINGPTHPIAKGSPHKLDFHSTWIWKMRVEDTPHGNPYYSMKVWKQGSPEPGKWDLRGMGEPASLTNGSIAFDAHHVDATFGNITIVPGPFMNKGVVRQARVEANERRR